MNRKEIGQLGENYAAQFLKTQDHQIIARNYHCRFGELDLISKENMTGQLCFVEVKTRSNDSFGLPEEAINYQKKQHLIKSCLHFLQSSQYFPIWRIDLIAVKLDAQHRLLSIQYLKNIFDGE